MAAHKRTYDWPRPAVTVDVVLFTVAGALQDMRLLVANHAVLAALPGLRA